MYNLQEKGFLFCPKMSRVFSINFPLNVALLGYLFFSNLSSPVDFAFLRLSPPDPLSLSWRCEPCRWARKLRSADAHLRCLSSDLFSASNTVWYFVNRTNVPRAYAKRGIISLPFSSVGSLHVVYHANLFAPGVISVTDALSLSARRMLQVLFSTVICLVFDQLPATASINEYFWIRINSDFPVL